MTVSEKRRKTSFGGGGVSTYQRRRFRTSTGQWVEHPSTNKAVGTIPLFTGTQFTESEDHQWPPQGSPGDVGGPFATRKRYGILPITPIAGNVTEQTTGVYSQNNVRYRYDVATPMETTPSGGVEFPTPLESSEEDLIAAGGTAISRCRPTASGVELSTALGELVKEGLPFFPSTQLLRERTASALGSEYLNAEFGWSPLTSDLGKFVDVVRKSGSVLQQYDADLNKPTRRRYSFPEERQIDYTVLSTSKLPWGVTTTGGLSSSYPTSGGQWNRTTTSYKRRWFSGAFVYGIPNALYSGSGISLTLAKADRLFGVSFTPDVLWDLSPWSWAIDWFTNIGDVLETTSDYVSQGLVMRYGYIMEHTIHEVKYTLTGATLFGQPCLPEPSRLITETKVRYRANPFGFGITWDGLSAAQTAILAALGISRT